MANYVCLIDCLCQDHETDSLGRYIELVNLRCQAGEVYSTAYDLLKFNDNPEGTVFFQVTNQPATKMRGSDLAPLPKRMPEPRPTPPAKKTGPVEYQEVPESAPKPRSTRAKASAKG